MKEVLKLPIIDLSSPDRWSTANTIRQACIKYGFFYVVNHGVEEELIGKVFEESNKFFSLPLEEKMKLILKEHRGYTPLFGYIVDPFSAPQGDCKESYYIGPLEDISSSTKLNQWPSHGKTMKVYRAGELQRNPIIAFSVGKRLLSLIALALDLNEDFFEKAGKLDRPAAFLAYCIILMALEILVKKHTAPLLIQIMERPLSSYLMVFEDFRSVGKNLNNHGSGKMLFI